MRDYAKLAPTFWTGTTGKALRKKGPEALIVALYLVSAPGSNMLGLYYQPLLFMAHETGLGIEGASKGLQSCIEAGFCSHDEDTEMVFVHEMAAWQIGESLSPKDLRCKGIQKDFEALPECPFLAAWYERYAADFNLTAKRDAAHQKGPEMQGPTQAPSKPHRSQEQEQEQEQEKKLLPAKAAGDPDGFAEFWSSWPSTPRKQDRKKCAEKWKRSGFGMQLPAIVSHVEALKHSKSWREGFEPAPLTYLNGERWQDGAPVGAINGADIFAGAK
jgi:hypothetical protein